MQRVLQTNDPRGFIDTEVRTLAQRTSYWKGVW